MAVRTRYTGIVVGWRRFGGETSSSTSYGCATLWTPMAYRFGACPT